VLVEVEVQQALGDDILHLGPLVQAGHGVLEDHLALADDLLVQLLGDLAVDLAALEQDLAPGSGVDAGDGTADGGLARARLAHQGERLALVDVEVDVVDGHELLAPRAEGDLEVLQFNELFSFSHWRGPPSFSCAGSGSSGGARSWAPGGPDTRSWRRGWATHRRRAAP